jgi:hypothetical protein
MVHFTPLSDAPRARSSWKKSPQAAVQVGFLHFPTVLRVSSSMLKDSGQGKREREREIGDWSQAKDG